MTFLKSLAILLCLCSGSLAQQPNHVAAEQDGVSVYFSPRGGCTEAIIGEIDGAETSIRIQAYSFTSVPIAQALLKAKGRGVDINVILDASQATSKYSSATFFFNQGIAVSTDPSHGAAHNKVVLIDDHTVITGSFNFSKNAEENNAENLLILRGKDELFAAYDANFKTHLEHAVPYTGLVAGPPAEIDDGEVFVTRTGEKYHRSTCRHLSGGGTSLLRSEASTQGLTPCGVCRP